MAKLWLIIKYEYTRHVLNKRFLFSLLSLPAVVAAMAIAVLAIAFFTADRSPIGYIDPSGVLADPTPVSFEGNLFNPVIQFVAYPDESQAQDALAAEQIQAYYLIPEGFPGDRSAELHFNNIPSPGAQDQFRQLILTNLDIFQTLDAQTITRLQEGSLVTLTTLDGGREVRSDQWFMFLMPMIAGMIFILVVLTSGGYLLQAVVSEKENRTMEIVITSVSPTQLMAGKSIGNIGVGLTQLIVWLVFGWIGLLLGAQFMPALGDLSLPGSLITIMFVVFIPAFVMVAAIMSTIGALMTEMREAQQISGIISLLIIVPFYVTTPIMSNPNGTLALLLSYFPLTAPITILMRMSHTSIPVWQITLNVIILVACAIFFVWLAGRAFRMGMLQYGKKLSLKQVLRKSEAV